MRTLVGYRHARERNEQRADIQGLRALAVGLVLIYHLRPGWLPGGFIGVDVFFVISGYLIIGTLAGEIRRTGRLRLLNFYARRVRRLLPAASVTLLAVVAATVILLPYPRWGDVMEQVVASALDVQNWLLAFFSADYAHATAAASPVQHFWSLSVEEQFYLVIPLVMVGTALAARRSPRPVHWVFGAIAVVTVASLAYSAIATPAPPQAAYFVTHTRMWELGIGGLAAMVVHRVRLAPFARLVLGWLGLAAVVISAFRLTTAMAFPGWIALAPTLGTVAMIVAGHRVTEQRRLSVELAVPMGVLPLRYLGDISYSLYLWHWPVIVFVLERSGTSVLTARQVLKVTALSLVLAILSKHLVEDPFRRRRPVVEPLPPAKRPFRMRLRATYALGATLVVATLVAATVPWQAAATRMDALLLETSRLDADHPGALAFDPVAPRPTPTGVPLVPDPAIASGDIAEAWRNGCASYNLIGNPAGGDACAFGNLHADRTLVLVGDSHATMFSTALIRYATESGKWRIKLMTHDGCAFGDLPPDESGYPLKVCADIAHQLLPALLDLKPDLVVSVGFTLGFSVKNGMRTWAQRPHLLDGYRQLLTPLTTAGIPVAVVRDVPVMTQNVPSCLLRNPDSPAACDTSRAAALGDEQDPLVEAVAGLPGTRVVDLTRWLCTATTCPAVIGNVVVYRDNHLTDTFVRTLTQPLISELALD